MAGLVFHEYETGLPIEERLKNFAYSLSSGTMSLKQASDAIDYILKDLNKSPKAEKEKYADLLALVKTRLSVLESKVSAGSMADADARQNAADYIAGQLSENFSIEIKVGKKKDEPKKETKEEKESGFLSPVKISFEWLTENPTYANMEKYFLQKAEGSESYSREELDFLKFFLVGKTALQDKLDYGLGEKEISSMQSYLGLDPSAQGRGDSSYLASTYGNYVKGKNDCYTYANTKVFRHYENVYEGKGNTLTGSPGNTPTGFGGGYERMRESTGSSFCSFSKFSKLNLQVGDAVGVDVSPNNTGNNHWGVVAVLAGKPVIIGRGSRLEVWTLEEFFQNARGVDVIRYGTSEYGEHVEYDVSGMHGKIVEGKQPGNFTN
ncbi:Uncharacterised protein [uncultured archaeon]|nr:Uncharacterised protein [uncultured archaeon]